VRPAARPAAAERQADYGLVGFFQGTSIPGREKSRL
jgi:hypothetical protein